MPPNCVCAPRLRRYRHHTRPAPNDRGKFPSLQGCDNYTYHNHKSRPMREIIKSQIPQQQHQPTNQEGGLPAFIISEDEGMPSRK